jgi:hypothetical protein
MYDPIPWHIDEIEAQRRSLSHAGWYIMTYDGCPVVGPHAEPEDCIMALHELPDEPCWAPPLQPSMPRRLSATA